MNTLDIHIRNKADKLDSLRKDGLMPAVFYGKKTASTPISVSLKDFIKVWKAVGESGVVTLKDKTASVDTLIHTVDMDPISGNPFHADFYVFEKGKKIDVSVPLEFIGVSPAVKDLSGNLNKILHEIKISADPQHIPHVIEVDISSLAQFGDVITASQIKMPHGVVLEENEEEVVASVSAPKEEVEEVSTPIDLSAIEVEKKGKKDEEAEPAE
ncbi:MAG: 50S ribosomal protein L25 [bacterium]